MIYSRRPLAIFLSLLTGCSSVQAITRQPSCPDLQQNGILKAITVTLTNPFTRERATREKARQYLMHRRHSSPDFKNRYMPDYALHAKKVEDVLNNPHNNPYKTVAQKNTVQPVTNSKKTVSGKQFQHDCIVAYKKFDQQLKDIVADTTSTFSATLEQLDVLEIDLEDWLSNCPKNSPFTRLFTSISEKLATEKKLQSSYAKNLSRLTSMLEYATQDNQLSPEKNNKLLKAVYDNAQTYQSTCLAHSVRAHLFAALAQQATALNMEDVD